MKENLQDASVTWQWKLHWTPKKSSKSQLNQYQYFVNKLIAIAEMNLLPGTRLHIALRGDITDTENISEVLIENTAEMRFCERWEDEGDLPLAAHDEWRIIRRVTA